MVDTFIVIIWNMKPIAVYWNKKKKPHFDNDVVAPLAPATNLWLSKKQSGSSICSTERLRVYKAIHERL